MTTQPPKPLTPEQEADFADAWKNSPHNLSWQELGREMYAAGLAARQGEAVAEIGEDLEIRCLQRVLPAGTKLYLAPAAPAEEPLHPALHSSAPPEHKCADCHMEKEPCPTCYYKWYAKRFPNTVFVGSIHPAPAAQLSADRIRSLVNQAGLGGFWTMRSKEFLKLSALIAREIGVAK